MISVVIPVFKYSEFFDVSIRSAIEQPVPKELICVSDNAEQNVLNFLFSLDSDYLADFQCSLKIIKLDVNSGPGAARKIGVLASKFNCIAFLDSDDVWPKDYLRHRLSLLDPSSLFFSASPHIYVYNEKSSSPNKGILREWPGSQVRFGDFLKSNPISNSSVIVSKELLAFVGYYSTLFKRNDYSTWLRVSRVKSCDYFAGVEPVIVNRLSCSLSSNKASLLRYQYRCFREVGLGRIASIYHAFFSAYLSLLN